MKTAGIIPARMNSTRFPGKPLKTINHREMIEWVYKAAKGSSLHDVCVATDSKKIHNFCIMKGMASYLTGEHKTGTDRVAEAAEHLYPDYTHIVNIQCDEPLLQSYMIDKMLDNIVQYEAPVETLGMIMRSSYKEMFKKDVVKVITDENGFAKKFARRMYPWHQGGKHNFPRQHVGIYAYELDTLREFVKLEQTPAEIDLSLEQLRLLDNNYSIHVTLCDKYLIGVDTPEDIVTIENLIGKGLVNAF